MKKVTTTKLLVDMQIMRALNFTSVEESLSEEIVSQLIDDIFNENYQLVNLKHIKLAQQPQ